MVVVPKQDIRKGAWLVPLCESPRVYTLFYKNKADLDRKIRFLQNRVPLYGLETAPKSFVSLLVKNTLLKCRTESVDSVCIAVDRPGCDDLIRHWCGISRRVQLVSDLYDDLAEALFDQTGAAVVKTCKPDTRFCIDLDKGCLYLHRKKLFPVGAGALDITALYGVYRDTQNADFFCDRWQFDNKREVSLSSLPIK